MTKYEELLNYSKERFDELKLAREDLKNNINAFVFPTYSANRTREIDNEIRELKNKIKLLKN